MLKLFSRHKHRKVFVVGLDCAPPAVLFHTSAENTLGLKDQLPNLSRMIDEGIYGPLSSSIPCITVPAWASMLSSKDPGILGFYGFRNRADHSYDRMNIATANAIHEKRVWEILSDADRTSIVVGVPQTYPIKPLKGMLISSFLTPSIQRQYTHPNGLRHEIERVLGGRPYDVDVPQFRTDDKDFLLRQIQEMTEKRFTVIKYLLREKPWEFFMFVEIGLDRIHHGMWKFWDSGHPKHEPGNPYQSAIPDYYRYLDQEVGEILGMLDEDTVVMVVSDHGAKGMDGGFAINEWLRREGLLVLKEEPRYEGLVPFEKVELYKDVRNVAPDLMVYFGNLRWRSLGSFGLPNLYTFENDLGPDDANHDQNGVFVLWDPRRDHGGRYVDGLQLMDVAPTVLDLMGEPVPPDMQGKVVQR
jgi:predicted AlkP superfamily phosphohydrolase/phosphomutase